MNLKNFSIIIILVFLVFSCDDKRKTLTDTVSSGTINVLADETYKPLLDSEKMVFETHYPKAKINIIYKQATDVLDDFENDSIRLFVTGQPMDSGYFGKYYNEKGYAPKSVILAKDAIAIIANKKRKGLKITAPEMASICSGEITDFSQLKNSKQSGKITLVFDNSKSSTVLYVRDSILKGKEMTANAYSQNTNEEVMTYVQENKNALAIIGANWISDSKDAENLEFSKYIFPVEIGAEQNSVHFYSPHPSYIAMHKYPFRRLMYATLKEGGPALGRGFVNFMTGEIGQRIVVKSGLAPSKLVTRIVQVRNKI